MRDPKRVAILISGRGSNMRALVEQADGYEVVLVASNKPHAAGPRMGARARASDLGVGQQGRRQGSSSTGARATRSTTIGVGTDRARRLHAHPLALVRRANGAGRIVNIHPSLLPKYRGLDTHARAIEAGDTVSGCSVHIVTEELDAGEVLGQAEVPIEPDDTPAEPRTARACRRACSYIRRS